MPLPKIRRYWNESTAESPKASLGGALIDALAESSLPGAGEDYETFRSELRRLKTVAETGDRETVDDAVRTAADLARVWNQRVLRASERRNEETGRIAEMLAESVAALGDAGETRVLARRVGRSLSPDEFDRLRGELARSLAATREKAERRQRETELRMEDLEHQSARFREKVDWKDETDPVTFLPGRSEGEKAMQGVIGQPGAATNYVLVCVLDRLHSVNARFGYSVGDQLFRSTRQYVQENLSPNDRMFRWTGPVMVTLLRRKESAEQVERELRRILDARPERVFDFGGRSATIRLSVAWTLLAITGSFDEIATAIQEVITSQTPRELAATAR